MKEIHFDDLLRGDVFLCHGTGLLSDMIMLLDGGQYSHAAFFDGQKAVEATERGIVADDVNYLSQEKYVDVYRFCKNGHHFGDPDWPVDPVVERSAQLVAEGHKFAYDHLVLMGLVALSRDVARLEGLSEVEQKILRVAMDHAAGWILEQLDKGKQPMVCSEAVYHIFADADPKNHYALTISGVYFSKIQALKDLESLPPRLDPGFVESHQKLYEAWTRVINSRIAATPADAGWDPAVACCVTPHDLEVSPDLTLLGRYVFS